MQCFRESSVADVEGQKGDAGPLEVGAGPFRVTQGQRWVERG